MSSFKTSEELIAFDEGVDVTFFSEVISLATKRFKTRGVTANIPTMDALRRSLALAEAIMRGRVVVEAKPVTASEFQEFIGRTFPHVGRQIVREDGAINADPPDEERAKLLRAQYMAGEWKQPSLPFVLGKSMLKIAKPHGEHQRFECFPMRIAAGKLVCCIQNGSSGWWEDWSLEHTISGVESGFYKVEEIPMRSEADSIGST
jgi:hypothetical protein